MTSRLQRRYALSVYLVILCGCVAAQSISPTSSAPWHSKQEQGLTHQLGVTHQPVWTIDNGKTYTLPELIDLAELHNPDTQAAWQRTRERAAELGIARSAYYPTLVAAVLAASLRQAALFDGSFHRQTIAFFQPTLNVDYLVFDLGGRAGGVDIAKANLLVENLQFNNTHRKVIYDVASAYYRLLSAKGQREAAEINLKNAETVEADTQSRLQNGLATKPDLLEATAARAQADYDLQATIGTEAIAASSLATIMGLPAETHIPVQSLSELSIPDSAAAPLEEEVDHAFQQRPELLQDVARIRAAQGALKQAKSEYFPELHFKGDGGLIRGYGQQDLLAGHYAEGETWSAAFELRWKLFDGFGREKRVAAANAQEKAAVNDLHAARDQIEQEVFTSYTNMLTAFRQRRAAASLLEASGQSYEAARRSFGLGLRSQLDVIAAQKSLAQARYEDVAARANLLFQVADLAFRTGDMIQLRSSQHGITP